MAAILSGFVLKFSYAVMDLAAVVVVCSEFVVEVKVVCNWRTAKFKLGEKYISKKHKKLHSPV